MPLARDPCAVRPELSVLRVEGLAEVLHILASRF